MAHWGAFQFNGLTKLETSNHNHCGKWITNTHLKLQII